MLHQVGVGTLGPVFRTYEPTRDRLVAIKVFRLDITPEQAQALADELSRTADAGLFHPSIVEPIAAGVEGSAYRADEYVAAETLDVAMRHYAPAPIEKVLPFIAQLAGAIDFARSAGVGHGGLHPRDIFVTPEEARASGFGVVDSLERVGLRAPVRRPYTAPERVAGEAWGVTADVFSLGVIAYELLTGRRPSGMGDRIGTITGGAHQAAIHGVLARAVAEDPARRYPSALAFASALDAASRGEAAAALPGPEASRAAALAAAPVPVDVDDAVADIPPPIGVHARREPVEAEQEEDAFRASEPEFDDIESERDEDEAHSALSLHEQAQEDARAAAAAGWSLFGAETLEGEDAVEDFAVERSEHRGTEGFADEFAGVAGARRSRDLDDYEEEPAPVVVPPQATHGWDDDEEPAVAPAPAYGRGSALTAEDRDEPPYADDAAVVPERRGYGLSTVALLVFLALLVGFAVGNGIGRAPAVDGETAAGVPTSGGAADQAASPQPFSEQDVTPGDPRPSSPPADPPSASVPAEPPPAPPAVPDPVATTARLDVRSTPSGAGVTVDGNWAGRTPLTLDDVAFGEHEVRVVQSGYEVARETVTLSSDRPARELSFRLRRAAPPPAPKPPAARPAPRVPAKPVSYTGTIFVDSRPRGARVLVNGKFMGTTPVRIPDISIGSQIVRLELENHRAWTTSTRVTAGQESRVTGSLEPIR